MMRMACRCTMTRWPARKRLTPFFSARSAGVLSQLRAADGLAPLPAYCISAAVGAALGTDWAAPTLISPEPTEAALRSLLAQPRRS